MICIWAIFYCRPKKCLFSTLHKCVFSPAKLIKVNPLPSWLYWHLLCLMKILMQLHAFAKSTLVHGYGNSTRQMRACFGKNWAGAKKMESEKHLKNLCAQVKDTKKSESLTTVRSQPGISLKKPISAGLLEILTN